MIRFINETGLISDMIGIIIAQVLLAVIIGLWMGAKFKDSPIIRFFGRNDWFVGAFLSILGYSNYLLYSVIYVKNLNLLLVVIGLVLILFSVKDHFNK